MDIGDWMALFVAITAVVLTILQSSWQRRHDRLSVKPFLSLHTQSDFDGVSGFLSVSLTNIGLGPAIVKKLLVKKGGLDSSFSQLLQEMEELETKVKTTDFALHTPSFGLAPNAELELLRFEFKSDNKDALENLGALAAPYVLEILFEGIHGDETFTLREKGYNI